MKATRPLGPGAGEASGRMSNGTDSREVTSLRAHMPKKFRVWRYLMKSGVSGTALFEQPHCRRATAEHLTKKFNAGIKRLTPVGREGEWE